MLPPMKWMTKASCLDKDTNKFYTENEQQIAATKAFCKACPVRLSCLDYALRNDEEWGIFGGLTPPERLKIKKMRDAKNRRTILN